MHAPSVQATPATDAPRASKDKGATSEGICTACPVDPTRIERVRIPKRSQGGYRLAAPPSSKRELGTATCDMTSGENAKIPPMHGMRGDKNAPTRGGYREGPQPSTQSHSLAQYQSHRGRKGTRAARKQMKGVEK